jgi:hypothetical protein
VWHMAIGLTLKIGADGGPWAEGTMVVMLYVFFVVSCVFFGAGVAVG